MFHKIFLTKNKNAGSGRSTESGGNFQGAFSMNAKDQKAVFGNGLREFNTCQHKPFGGGKET
ncbi:hypothetical protein [Methylomicrobium lacus]|uniref:hypothetical protein n=1 Tax=Methylomicrobium lacus TaxID=136992 RepID=UPI0035A8A60C